MATARWVWISEVVSLRGNTNNKAWPTRHNTPRIPTAVAVCAGLLPPAVADGRLDTMCRPRAVPESLGCQGRTRWIVAIQLAADTAAQLQGTVVRLELATVLHHTLFHRMSGRAMFCQRNRRWLKTCLVSERLRSCINHAAYHERPCMRGENGGNKT